MAPYSSTTVLLAAVAAITVGSTLAAAQGRCYDGSTPYPLPMPTDAEGNPTCGLGYYCPGFVAGDSATYPLYCAPQPECIIKRSFGNRCDLQSNQEPAVCDEGYYCPTPAQQLECPEGHYCTFATYEPHKCPPLSSCPAGSSKVLYFGGIVASLCLVAAFVVLLLSYRFWWKFAVLNTNYHEAERFLSAVSARSQESPGILTPGTMAQVDNDLIDDGGDHAAVVARRKRAIAVLAGGFLMARSTKPLTYEIRNLKVFAPKSASSERKGQSFSAAARKQASIEKRERQMASITNLAQMLTPTLSSPQTPQNNDGLAKTGWGGDGAPRTDRVAILKGVTATFAPATVTAIVGPGGAGKSTLLNALLGRLPDGWEAEGYVAVNGDDSADVLHRLRPVSGSATQTEPLHRELTVYQNLYYASEVRLPRAWSAEDRNFFLAATIEALQLVKQKDMPIGDEESRGISGGQRRRCHIGLEIAAAPYSLFLDEPTNGLDSTTALEVCSCLSAIATGADLTVVMTISQPRVEIWNQLDDIIVIAKGGNTVYQGKRADSQQFFEDIYGVTFRKNGNPADIIVDAVAERGPELAAMWEEYSADPEAYMKGRGKGTVHHAPDDESVDDNEATRNQQLTGKEVRSDDEGNAAVAGPPMGVYPRTETLPGAADVSARVSPTHSPLTPQRQPHSAFSAATDALKEEEEDEANADEGDAEDSVHDNEGMVLHARQSTANPSGATLYVPEELVRSGHHIPIDCATGGAADEEGDQRDDRQKAMREDRRQRDLQRSRQANKKSRISVNRQGAPLWRQIQLIFARTTAKQLSDLQPFIVEQFVNVVVAAIIGMSTMGYKPYWIYKYYELLSPPENDLLPQVLMYLCMSLGIVCVLPGSGIIVTSRQTYFREAASGFNRFAYYVGILLSLQPRMVLTALVFSTIFQLISMITIPFGTLFLFVWLITNCSYAVGMVAAMVFEEASAPLVGSLGVLFFGCLSGFIDFPRGLKFISYAFWASSYLQRAFQEPVAHAMADLARKPAWISDDNPLCIGITFLILAIIHVAAYVLLVVMFRDKQR